jgi:hypothetical protein
VTRRRSRASDVGGAGGAGGAGAEDEDRPAVNKSGRPSRRAAAACRGKRYVVESSEGEDEEDDEDEDGEEDGEERQARSGRGMEAGSRSDKKRARLFEGVSSPQANGVRGGIGEERSEGTRGVEASSFEERKRMLAKANAAYRAIFKAAAGPTRTFFRYYTHTHAQTHTHTHTHTGARAHTQTHPGHELAGYPHTDVHIHIRSSDERRREWESVGRGGQGRGAHVR